MSLPSSSLLYRVLAGVAGMASLAAPLGAQTTAATVPHGVMVATLPVGSNGLAFSLVPADLYTGIVGGNTGATLTFGSGNVGGLLTAGGKYYVEVVTGPLEGDRLDVNTAPTITSGNATVTVDLTATSNSTLAALGANVLVGARCVVRPHMTLGKLSAMLTPGLVGNNSSALADGVEIYGPAGFGVYFLRGDGVTWRQGVATADQSGFVIPPDASIVLQLHSGAKTWTSAGVVRSNDFVKKLVAGSQPFATGYPIDLSPAAIGAFADPLEPASLRWVGGAAATGSDNLLVYNPASASFATYFLHADGTTWTLAAGGPNVSAAPVIPAVGMTVLTRVNADAAFLILRPYSL